MNTESYNTNDRPYVVLSLSDKGLTVKWGPQEGPWDIFSGKPCTCSIKRWELHVGTKKKPTQPDDPNERIGNEIIPKKIPKGTFEEMLKKQEPLTNPNLITETETFIPREELEKKVQPKEQILARVIGYFDLKDEKGQIIEYGIYSDVARLPMDYVKPHMSHAS